MIRRPLSLAFLAALVAACLAPAAGAQDPAVATLTGRITDDAGHAIPVAQLVAHGAGAPVGATADDEGRYTLRLPGGTWTIRIRALGYRPTERVVTVGASARQQLDIVMVPAPTLLGGQVVTATRSAATLSELPASVSVVTREDIVEQGATSSGLAELLGKSVPGLATSTQSMSTYGQSLRGRNMSVLIDGVPLSTMRPVSRDLVTIDPAAIERVEVVRGTSAIYGDGATGGVINIITRAPGIAGPRLQHSSSVEMGTSLTGFGAGTGVRVAQGVSGQTSRLDFSIHGSASTSGGFYDADGDRIPSDPHGQGGLADTRSWDALAKVGIGRPAGGRLQLMANMHDLVQKTDLVLLPNSDPDGKALVRRGLQLDEPQRSRNAIVSLDYTRDVVLGGRLHAQLFHRDYNTRFGPFASRVSRLEPASPDNPDSLVRRTNVYPRQSYVDSWKSGGRLEHEVRARAWLPAITWGADVAFERTYQALDVFDRDTWQQNDSLVYRYQETWMWVPPLRSRSLGLFAQTEMRPLSFLLLRGGVRHERARIDVRDYQTIEQYDVQGGTLRYRPVLFNVGTVVTPTRGVDLFANYSQGFSLADIGRILRGARSGYILGTHQVDAQRVDQVEVGARGVWNGVQSSLSLYRNWSELGSTYDANLNVVRSPERVRGLEATIDAQPGQRWQTGATLTWAEGEIWMRRDTLSTDSVWKALGGYRIQPLKATAYLQHETRPWLRNRISVLHSADRDRAYEEYLRYDGNHVGGSQIPVDRFTLVDVSSIVTVGRGTLTLGIQNLLNERYFTPVSQLEGISGEGMRAAGRGRTLSVGYSITY